MYYFSSSSSSFSSSFSLRVSLSWLFFGVVVVVIVICSGDSDVNSHIWNGKISKPNRMRNIQQSSLPKFERPNILFILADDMGYGDLGVYSVYPNKSSNYKLITPYINQMASDGLMFTDAYAGAPVCAPSRCTLVTGLHSGHCSVRENGPLLAPGSVSVAELLRDYGEYDTAMFGKWGLGQVDTDDPSMSYNDPVSLGFNYYQGQMNQNDCHNYYPYVQWTDQQESYLPKNENASKTLCQEPNFQKCDWSGDVWTNGAVDYLLSPERHKQPFFLYVSYTTPHSGDVGDDSEEGVPIPRIQEGPYYLFNSTVKGPTGKFWPYVEVQYATAVTWLDELTGTLLSALDQNGLTNNTIVFFTSDNGASNEGGQHYQFFASSGNLSGYKRSLKEGGHRSPLIIKWPNQIPPGQVTNYQWTFYDFLATALDLAQVNQTVWPYTDGISMLPLLLGKQDAQPVHEFIYHEYCEPNEDTQGWGQQVRMGNWTGLCIGNKPLNESFIPVCNYTTFLLYNLETDLGQENNLAQIPGNLPLVQQMLEIMKDQHTTGNYCIGA